MRERVSEVRVQRVTRLFGATPALRGISCAFEAGTLTFVQGSNGAGKSTLLSILATLLRPSSGTVEYLPFGDDPLRVRRHVGWVAHESHCYRDLTGRENVELAGRLYGELGAGVVERVGLRVGAGPFYDQPVATLSRGQKQRVALARALVHSPSVLLLDEPMSGLDRASVARFEDVVTEERDGGAVVVVVSHRDEWVKRFGGRRIVLERGRLAEG